MTEAYNQIILMLQANAVHFRILEHEPASTMEDYTEKLPFPKEKLVKTLVFRVKNAGWVFVATKGESKIDFGKLAKNLNIARDRFERPGPAEIENELGFQIGGIGPFPTKDNITIVVDTKVCDLDVIYCGAGRNDRSLEIDPAYLLKACSPKICDITR